MRKQVWSAEKSQQHITYKISVNGLLKKSSAVIMYACPAPETRLFILFKMAISSADFIWL
jgi:hypothetical protein